MTRRLAPRLGCERGDALIEGMLALGLVLLVVCFAGQAIAYVHARNIAEAAAQDGASDAASGGPQAGISRAEAILTAAGGAGAHLHADRQHRRGRGHHHRGGGAAEAVLAAAAAAEHPRGGEPAGRAVRPRRAGGDAMTRFARRLRGEEGQGIVQALLLLAGVLLPLMFLVALFGRIEQGRLAAAQTARDAVRAASQAASQPAAEQAANAALARAQTANRPAAQPQPARRTATRRDAHRQHQRRRSARRPALLRPARNDQHPRPGATHPSTSTEASTPTAMAAP